MPQQCITVLCSDPRKRHVAVFLAHAFRAAARRSVSSGSLSSYSCCAGAARPRTSTTACHASSGRLPSPALAASGVRDDPCATSTRWLTSQTSDSAYAHYGMALSIACMWL